MSTTFDMAATASNAGWLCAGPAAGGPKRRRGSVPMFIPSDQVYYWSVKWQRDERESLEQLNAGNFREFDNPKDLVRWLLSDD